MAKNDNANVSRKLQEAIKNYGEPVNEIGYTLIANESGNAVEVQPSFTKPNRRQRLRSVSYSNLAAGGADTWQAATRTSTTRIYFVGLTALTEQANISSVYVWDAVTGNNPTQATDTIYTDSVAFVWLPLKAAVNDYNTLFLPIPKEVSQGIRVQSGAAATQVDIILWYIEEQIEN